MWLHRQEDCEWLVTKVKPTFEVKFTETGVPNAPYVCGKTRTHIHTIVYSVIHSQDLMVSVQQRFFHKERE